MLTHCSRGGVYYKGWRDPASGKFLWPWRRGKESDKYADPARYEAIAKAYPKLRICLAHYGGRDEWRDYLTDPHKVARPNSWVKKVSAMPADYPNGEMTYEQNVRLLSNTRNITVKDAAIEALHMPRITVH